MPLADRPIFFDTHAHLDYPDYQPDLPEVFARAGAAGITKVICIGTDLASSERAVAIAARFPQVYAAVGWHPAHADEAPDDLRPALRALAAHPKTVAIGETGFDFYRMPSAQPGGTAEADERYRQNQVRIFTQQLEVAAECGLNCVIHQRNSLVETLAPLEACRDKVHGVFHCFSGDGPTLQRILAMGSLVSFTGILTFKNGENVRDALRATPLGSFMLETDSPYLAPVPYRGKRCEPAYVKEIAALAAEIKGCSLEVLSQATCATAHAFFPKMRG